MLCKHVIPCLSLQWDFLVVCQQPTSCPCLASACCFFFWHVRILASHPASRQVSAPGLFSFFCPPCMANAFIDEAMRSYGGKEWRFESLPVPRCEVKMPGDMDAPITVEDFLSCCRQPSGVKTTVMILDVQLAVSDCGSPGDVALALKEQRVASLPVALHFAESPPADSKVGGIVMDKGNGQLDVIKYVTFKDKVPTREATKLAGSAYVPFPRPGPWSEQSRRLSSPCCISIGYKKMLCLDGEGPSRLTTFDIKWPMSMKESSWMIPTARTSPWLTWSPSWQWKKNKRHQVVTMMQSSPEIAWERMHPITWIRLMNQQTIPALPSQAKSSWRWPGACLPRWLAWSALFCFW